MRKIDIVTPVECPTLSPERQLLWEAANYMEKHGKEPTGMRLEDENGCVCIRGAIRKAMGHGRGDDFVWADPVYQAAEGLIASRVPGGHVNVFNINNDQATVVAAMRSAALS
jgi:hypothetical protein